MHLVSPADFDKAFKDGHVKSVAVGRCAARFI